MTATPVYTPNRTVPGHLIARQFGGMGGERDGGRTNIVMMFLTVNQNRVALDVENMRIPEKRIAIALASCKEVSVDVSVSYHDADAITLWGGITDLEASRRLPVEWIHYIATSAGSDLYNNYIPNVPA